MKFSSTLKARYNRLLVALLDRMADLIEQHSVYIDQSQDFKAERGRVVSTLLNFKDSISRGEYDFKIARKDLVATRQWLKNIRHHVDQLIETIDRMENKSHKSVDKHNGDL